MLATQNFFFNLVRTYLALQRVANSPETLVRHSRGLRWRHRVNSQTRYRHSAKKKAAWSRIWYWWHMRKKNIDPLIVKINKYFTLNTYQWYGSFCNNRYHYYTSRVKTLKNPPNVKAATKRKPSGARRRVVQWTC